MIAPWRWDRLSRLAAGGAAAGLVLLGVSARGAVVLAPAPAPAALVDAEPLPALSPPGGIDPGAVRRAVARDPFRADRRGAAARYVPPEQRRSQPPAGARTRDPFASLRLVGTAAEGGAGALAIIAGLARTPRVVRVGDPVIGGWRLTTVAGGVAVLEHRDSATVIRITRTGTERVRR